jgi:hypothetical protein
LGAAPSTQANDIPLGNRISQASAQFASGSGNMASIAFQPNVDAGTSNISLTIAQGDSTAAAVSGEK